MSEELIDSLAREIYQSRSQSPTPMTDERWARIKTKFRSSVTVCREDAIAMIESGELYE